MKQELAALPLEKTCCMTAELNALTACCASLTLQGRGRAQLRYRTLSASVLKRIFMLLKSRHGLVALPRQTRLNRFGGQRQFELQLNGDDSRTLLRAMNPGAAPGELAVLRGVPKRVARRICCRRAWIRGAFLGCGTLSDPEKGYRAAFRFDEASRADYLVRLLALNGVSAGRVQRRGGELVQVRDGDALVTLMGMMGATRAVLHIENLRAAASLREGVNRATNCDHANVLRQLHAAQRQVEQITRLSLGVGLASLPPELEALARLRLANPDVTLAQLGELLEPPISKSGVQHRMARITRKLQALAGREEGEKRDAKEGSPHHGAAADDA
ncbi:MAG: DNA-binding protein WhiA [Christensenellales bacterium]